MTTMVDELVGTAYHEAGHAAACIHLRRGFRSVSIVEGDSNLGHVAMKPPGAWFEPEMARVDTRIRHRIEDEIIISFAGSLSEEKHMGRSNDAGAGAVPIEHPEATHVLLTGSDLSWICDLAEVVCGSEDETTAYIEWLRQRTLVLLDHQAVWPCVEALAAALLEHKTLSSSRAKKIFWEARENLFEQQRRAWEKRVAPPGPQGGRARG